MDAMSQSPEFQKMVVDASKLGVLIGASLVGPAI